MNACSYGFYTGMNALINIISTFVHSSLQLIELDLRRGELEFTACRMDTVALLRVGSQSKV